MLRMSHADVEDAIAAANAGTQILSAAHWTTLYSTTRESQANLDALREADARRFTPNPLLDETPEWGWVGDTMVAVAR